MVNEKKQTKVSNLELRLIASLERVLAHFESLKDYDAISEGYMLLKEIREKTSSNLLTRITVNPSIFGGKPIIRGRRLAVEHILGMLAAGSSVEEILREYDWLELEDIQACFLYACRMMYRTEFP